MRRTTIVAAILASLAFGARANDGVELSLRSKAIASASAATLIREAQASPASAAETMMPLLPVMGETETLNLRSNICTGREVCYDAAAGHIVVRPAREYMPRINGLTAENLSVRHNRVVFTYSFK
jgi:hypothetical protein